MIREAGGISPDLLQIWATQYGGCHLTPKISRDASSTFSGLPESDAEKFAVERCNQDTCVSFHYVGIALGRKIFLCHTHKHLHFCSGLEGGPHPPDHKSDCWKVFGKHLVHICWIYARGVATELRKKRWGRSDVASTSLSAASLRTAPTSFADTKVTKPFTSPPIPASTSTSSSASASTSTSAKNQSNKRKRDSSWTDENSRAKTPKIAMLPGEEAREAAILVNFADECSVATEASLEVKRKRALKTSEAEQSCKGCSKFVEHRKNVWLCVLHGTVACICTTNQCTNGKQVPFNSDYFRNFPRTSARPYVTQCAVSKSFHVRLSYENLSTKDASVTFCSCDIFILMILSPQLFVFSAARPLVRFCAGQSRWRSGVWWAWGAAGVWI